MAIRAPDGANKHYFEISKAKNDTTTPLRKNEDKVIFFTFPPYSFHIIVMLFGFP